MSLSNTIVTPGRARSEIGARLWQHRVRLGVTQVEAAELAGVSQRTVSRLENGTGLTPAAVQLASTYAGLWMLRSPKWVKSS